jgi:predicted MFS family arabinose efflux permease
VLYAQAFLLMGGFVAVYNYLGFRLEQPPFSVRPGLTALLFLAYLAGTVSSRVAGTAAATAGRRPVLVASTAVLGAGVLLTLPPVLPLVVVGLVLLTAGFFAAHAVAAGWVGARATAGRAQAASLYNVAYYAGSSVVGWAAGGAFLATGWPGLALLVLALAAVAAAWALLDARRAPDPEGAS